MVQSKVLESKASCLLSRHFGLSRQSLGLALTVIQHFGWTELVKNNCQAEERSCVLVSRWAFMTWLSHVLPWVSNPASSRGWVMKMWQLSLLWEDLCSTEEGCLMILMALWPSPSQHAYPKSHLFHLIIFTINKFPEQILEAELLLTLNIFHSFYAQSIFMFCFYPYYYWTGLAV